MEEDSGNAIGKINRKEKTRHDLQPEGEAGYAFLCGKREKIHKLEAV